jgi:DNA mismatch repair protein MutS2
MQGGLSVVTTHLGELKDLAAQETSIVNASLQFDTEAMRPTFRLIRDRPGRSYALEIARRLGLPDDVLATARSRLTGGERRVEALLSELEQREAEVNRLAVEARQAAHETSVIRQRLDETAERLGKREKEVERQARKRVEEYLLQARRAVESEVEALRRKTRDASQDAAAPTESVDAAVRAARAGVEQLVRENRSLSAESEQPRPPGSHALVVGEGARSHSLAVEGEVLEIRGDEAILDAGGMRFALALADLEPTGRTARSRVTGSAAPLPEIAPLTEVDMRGLRVDEVEGFLAQGLDAAFVNDVPRLRIIHGKGTGALRREVARVLDGDSRVRAHRPGGFQEGGSGVTVVEFAGAID